MNRRTLIATLGIGLSASSLGCLEDPAGQSNDGDEPTDSDESNDDESSDDESNDDSETTLPTELVETEFITDGVSNVPDVDEPPTIRVEPSDATAIVEGTISYSSSTCGEAFLDRAEYGPETGSANVRVAGRTQQDAGEVCTDDIVSQPYRVTLTFDAGVPESIEAIEAGNLEEFSVTY